MILKLLYRGIRNTFLWIRRSILIIGCLFFLAINILTLTSNAVQSALSTSLGLMGVSTVLDLMQRSENEAKSKFQSERKRNGILTSRNGNLSQRNTALATDLGQEKIRAKRLTNDLQKESLKTKFLATDNTKLRKSNQLLETANKGATKAVTAQKVLIKKLGKRVTTRTMKAAEINLASIPAESVPWVGIGVVVTVTAVDLHMACDNVNDMDELYRTMGIDPGEDQGSVVETCLGYIHKFDEYRSNLTNLL